MSGTQMGLNGSSAWYWPQNSERWMMRRLERHEPLTMGDYMVLAVLASPAILAVVAMVTMIMRRVAS